MSEQFNRKEFEQITERQKEEREAFIDNAHGKALEDNKRLEELSVEQAEIKGGKRGEEKGKGDMSPLESLRASGYLDTSFEGKETHALAMRALSKEEALAEYKKSGGATWVWDELEKNMPYTVPNAESLDVMMMNFNKDIRSDEALVEMDVLGVRPLTYEELIQYGIAHPSHQEQKVLIGLGSNQSLVGSPRAPALDVRDGVGRKLFAYYWGNDWDDRFRFPVVRK